MDRWIDGWSMEKLSRSLLGNGMVERAAATAFLSSERELRFREQQVLTVPLCGARYGWRERERDIEGRREEQSCNERSTAAKLAIAYYIIHEWRSFRRARIGPGDSFFCHRRRDCEKQKQRTVLATWRAFPTNLRRTLRRCDERRCRNPFPRANFANEFC